MEFSSIRRGISVTLSLAMLMGSPLLATEPTDVRSADYRLGINGVLTGSVVNQIGQPVRGLPVEVIHMDQQIAVVVSDENGSFSVDGLQNGPHTVKFGASRQAVRFWRNSTAVPPTAQSGMTIVVDEAIVRGQAVSGWGMAAGVAVIGGFAAAVVLSNSSTRNYNPVNASPASP